MIHLSFDAFLLGQPFPDISPVVSWELNACQGKRKHVQSFRGTKLSMLQLICIFKDFPTIDYGLLTAVNFPTAWGVAVELPTFNWLAIATVIDPVLIVAKF